MSGVRVPKGNEEPDQSYIKVTERMRRMSGIFQFLAVVSVLGLIVGVLAVLFGGVTAFATVGVATIVPSVAFYTAHLVLDFLIDLGDRVEYMERVQNQQHKILKDLYQRARDKSDPL
jgi:uncharacterized membrane protein YphA (DoxX/SURF4 family)